MHHRHVLGPGVVDDSEAPRSRASEDGRAGAQGGGAALWMFLLLVCLVGPGLVSVTVRSVDPAERVSFEEAQRALLRGRQGPRGAAARSVDAARWHVVAGSRAFSESECPPTPAVGYPREYPVFNVTENWNPDDPNVPARHFASLCRFDYQNEHEKAKAYLKREVPFLVHNVPGIAAVVRDWANVDYLDARLGSRKYLTEVSQTNHFMYFMARAGPRGWKPPNENRRMSFQEWFRFALRHENETSEDTPHAYFRVNSFENGFLNKDLQILTPKSRSLFVVDPLQAKGIHCRFGMRGINAAAHFDGSRNFVGLLGGFRRYFIAHPKACKTTYLHPNGHPSGRHSQVDWSRPDLGRFPDFSKTTVSEVILTAGDFMYIPGGWMHYVMSLNVNWQCNARSGKGPRLHALADCGF